MSARHPSAVSTPASAAAFCVSADPFLHPLTRNVTRRAKRAGRTKIAFERYGLAKVRRDLSSPHFEWQGGWDTRGTQYAHLS